MRNVSQAVKDAFNAPVRHVVARVEIYFDGPQQPPTVYENEDIIDMSILEESEAESNNPLGSVSSNELYLALANRDNALTPTNEESPFYKKLVPKVLVRPYFGVEVEEDVYEYLSMGSFYTTDWSAPTSGMVASVTCYDKMYDLGQMPVPQLPVMTNTTLYEMFEVLFQAIGLKSSEYSIDRSLTYSIEYGWYPPGTVKQALQAMAVSGCCSICMNRDDRVVVTSNFKVAKAGMTLAEHNQIFNADCQPQYSKIYSSVTMEYSLPVLGDITEVLKIEGITIPTGGIKLKNLAVSTGPIVWVSTIALRGAKNAYVEGFSYGAWGVSLDIVNTGPPDVVDIQVIGCPINTVKASYTTRNEELVKSVGVKDVKVESYLVQGMGFVQEYANLLLQLVSDPTAFVTVNCRANPVLELNDTVTLDDAADKLVNVEVVPIRYQYNFSEGLSGSFTAVKRSSRVLQDWVCVCPGMYIKADRQIF